MKGVRLLGIALFCPIGASFWYEMGSRRSAGVGAVELSMPSAVVSLRAHFEAG